MSKLNIEVYFQEDRQMNRFVNMLAWMEFCGNIGHCTDFFVRLDGDGSARPKFKFETEELQKSYEELRHSMLDVKYPMPKEEVQVDMHFSID